MHGDKLALSSKIHSICLCKNEEDIIELCLNRALEWSDYIYVLDNGSTDRTWEIVEDCASDRIIAWRTLDEPFREGLRNRLFNAFRSRATSDDWWCRLDADEFYVDDPRTFLSQVHRRYQVVWGVAIEYYLTELDLQNVDFDASIEDVLNQIRGYRIDHSEARFFRYRHRLEWNGDQAWPRHMGLSCPRRIRFKNYKYRTPTQIQKRLATRISAIERGFEGFKHAAASDWRSKIADNHTLEIDRGDGFFSIDQHALPDHLGSFGHRMLKWFLHSSRFWP